MAETIAPPLQTLRWRPHHRKFLVSVRTSAVSAVLVWLDFAKERSWDLLLNFYDQLPADLPPAEMITFGGITKFPSIWETNRAHDDCFLKYRATLFLDGDLDLRFADIDRLFAIFCEFNLALAQPALTQHSYSSWPITLHHPSCRLRFTDFVEIMAPMFSDAALARCLPTFPRSISGWGLDLVWPILLGLPSDGVAIIDEITMTHTGAVDPKHGRFYEYLRALGVDPYDELRRLKQEHGLGSDHRPRQLGTVPGPKHD